MCYSYLIWEKINTYVNDQTLYECYLLTGELAIGYYLITQRFFDDRIITISHTLTKLYEQGHYSAIIQLYQYYSYHKILIDQTLSLMYSSFSMIHKLNHLINQ